MKLIKALCILALVAGCETNNYFTVNNNFGADAGAMAVQTTDQAPYLAPDASASDMQQIDSTSTAMADTGTTRSIDAQITNADMSPPATPSIGVNYGGPLSGEKIATGQRHTILGWQYSAKTGIGFRAFRFTLSVNPNKKKTGLLNRETLAPNYVHFSLETRLNQSFGGIVELKSDRTRSEIQTIEFKDNVVVARAGDPIYFNLSVDVVSDSSLDGDSLEVQLEPFQPGDIVLMEGTNTIGNYPIETWKENPGIGGPTILSVVYNTINCLAGETRPCYSGPTASNGVGQCHSGTQRCVMTENDGQWDASCVGETTPYPFGDKCSNGIDEDCDGRIDNAIQIVVSGGNDSHWQTLTADGEMLRFSLIGTLASQTRISKLDVLVEYNNLLVGKYRLYITTENGATDITDQVHFFDDANRRGYHEGDLDLSKEFYPPAVKQFTLGIQWKTPQGLIFPAYGKIELILSGVATVPEGSTGGTVHHFNAHTDSSCSDSSGKMITITPKPYPQVP